MHTTLQATNRTQTQTDAYTNTQSTLTHIYACKHDCMHARRYISLREEVFSSLRLSEDLNFINSEIN